MQRDFDWPELGEARDGPTIATLHLVSQIVGKVAVALVPWRNHGWHVALHLHPRGLRTEPIHMASGTFELGLDLLAHAFTIDNGKGRFEVPLRAVAIADFHDEVMAALADAGHLVRIHARTNEIEPVVELKADRELRPYETDSAERLLRALLSADRVLRLFRSAFLGKVSPVHFFWGSFDLAVTRFSGRPAPLHPGGMPYLPDPITQEAYSHEVSSAGFWPGGANGGSPMFYSYAYPAPDGFPDAAVRPEQARFDPGPGEFVLDYEAVRGAPDPDAAVMAFLTSTYEAAADLGRWDRPALECGEGQAAVPRAL